MLNDYSGATLYDPWYIFFLKKSLGEIGGGRGSEMYNNYFE
jgi:hypothetical protein